MIRLLIPGEPSTVTAQQKGVNFNVRRFYTKTAVAAEKRRLIRNLRIWDGTDYVPLVAKHPTPLTVPVHVSVKYVFPLTQELAKKHAAHLADPKFEAPHGVRPDFDNSLKLLLDVLTGLRFWEDDGLIDDANIHKRRGTYPRIVIAIDQCRPV